MQVKALASKEQWRKAHQKYPMHDLPGLAFKTSQTARELVTKRFESLTYKESNVIVGTPATELEIKDTRSKLSVFLSEKSFLKIDSISKAEVLSDEVFKEFMDKHMRLTAYSLSIKKCTDPQCSFHTNVSLPMEVFADIHFLPAPLLKCSDKYQDFDDVYGQEPNERDRPSLQRVCSDPKPIKPDFQLQASKARIIVKCVECEYPRLLYTRKKLDAVTKSQLADYLDLNLYVCGTEVPNVYTPKLFDCYDPISSHYFQIGDKLEGFKKICRFCLCDKVKPLEKSPHIFVCDKCYGKQK